MFTRLTTALMAGALALASATTPTGVRAANDTGKIIGGLAIGAILGAVIANEIKDRKDDRKKAYKRTAPHGNVATRHLYDDRGRADRHRGYQRKRGRHDGYGQRRVRLPGACRVGNGH